MDRTNGFSHNKFVNFQDSKMPKYLDWSNIMLHQQQQQHQRYTFNALHRPRKRPFYPQRWKTFNTKDSIMNKSNNGNSKSNDDIFYELDRINYQIQTLQSQIVVLKQQLRIIQTNCVPLEKSESSDQSIDQSAR